ncbi:YfhO family protein [Streptococcus dentasini]
MKNFFTKHKVNLLFYSLSFLIPTFIMLVALWSKGIYWGSKTTILASDGFHQYVIFATQLRNILHGSDSLFYTFTSGLGLNFYALISYYLGSFLSPFYYFFSVKSMADAIYLFTLIKFGLIGLSMSFTLKRLFVNIKQALIISLSSSYSLMSFAVSQLEINTWLDVFILAPLIILGLHSLLDKQKFWLYYLTLSLLFIQNYYFGFMMAIFLTLYFLVQLSRDFRWKLVFRKFLDFTVVSILSGLTASIMLLPSYLDLSTHGEEFSQFNSLLSEKAWFFDIFAKNFVGAYDTTKFGAIPMIYVGLFPLSLALIFFSLRTLKWPVKLAYGLLLGFMVASFYLSPLDLIWQGMHTPNMFLHRYAWLFSLLIILMAAESLSHIKEFQPNFLIVTFSALASGFVLTFLYTTHYHFLKPVNLILTLAFLLAYAVILLSFNRKQLSTLAFILFTLLFSTFEIGLNSYYQVTSLGDEWIFPSREGYNREQTEITSLVKKAKSDKKSFFRLERTMPQTGNDSMKFNYNGISQFSSIRNTASSSTLDRLGFQSTGTNLNLRYQNNTIIADSLFNITYNLSAEDIDKYGFTSVANSGLLTLYKNKNASQMAILTKGVYKDLPFTVNTLDNQALLLNHLSGLHQQYFTHLSSQSATDAVHPNFNNRINLETGTGQTKAVTYKVQTIPNQQVYISIPDLSFSNDTTSSLTVTANGKDHIYTTDNAYSFFDLGYFNKPTELTVTLSFPENNQISFETPTFYGLDTRAYQRAMTTINNRKVSVRTSGSQVHAKYSAKKAGSLFFTLPYDKGWTAKINGHRAKIRRVQKGFMAIDVPAGKGKVELNYLPNGFKIASFLSLLGFLLFISYSSSRYFWSEKKIKASGD